MKIEISKEQSFTLNYGDVLVLENGKLYLVVDGDSYLEDDEGVALIDLETSIIETSFDFMSNLIYDIQHGNPIACGSRIKQIISSNQIKLSLAE